MLFRKSIVFILMLLLVASVVPVRAQDGGLPDDQQALLEIVTSAIDNFNSLDSYRYSGDQTTAQTISTGVGIRAVTVNQATTQTLSGSIVLDGEVANSTQLVSQVIETQINTRDPESFSMDFEVVSLDGDVYLRFPVVPEETRAMFPADWVDASEAAGYEGLGVLDLDVFADLISQTLPLYELTSENVLEVEELEGNTVRGQEVRVFRVVIDPALALSEASEQLVALLGVEADLVEQILDSGAAELVISVGVEDNLVYEIASTATIEFESDDFQGSNVALDQTTTSSFRIIEFNPEVEITVPEPAPPAEEETTDTQEDATDSEGESPDDTSDES